MTSYLALTAEQVQKAVDAVKKSKPIYAELLQFYGKLFIIQEEAKTRIRLEPIHISDKLRSIKAQEKLPLTDVNGFVYDKRESDKLFMAVNHLAKDSNPKLADSAETIVNAVGTRIKPEVLFAGLLSGNETIFENLAAELEISKQVLGFFTYNSLKPSLCVCGDQLAVYLDPNAPWQEGYCPICGSAPILSMLEQEGQRNLVCSFCWQVWSVKRVHCPFCGSSQDKDLHYFYSEEEKDARVDMCDHCKKYIKTLDTRKTDRLIYSPLEHVSSLHLDIKAQEIGFSPGIDLCMQL